MVGSTVADGSPGPDARPSANGAPGAPPLPLFVADQAGHPLPWRWELAGDGAVVLDAYGNDVMRCPSREIAAFIVDQWLGAYERIEALDLRCATLEEQRDEARELVANLLEGPLVWRAEAQQAVARWAT